MALFVGAMEVSLYALGEGILVTFVLLYSVIVKFEETVFSLQKKYWLFSPNSGLQVSVGCRFSGFR